MARCPLALAPAATAQVEPVRLLSEIGADRGIYSNIVIGF